MTKPKVKRVTLNRCVCAIPNFRYSSKCFAQILRAQYEAAMYGQVPPWYTNMVAAKYYKHLELTLVI